MASPGLAIDELAEIERRLAVRMIAEFGLDTSAVATDMTNFATYIGSTTARSDIAQRGKANGARPSRSAPTCGWSASDG